MSFEARYPGWCVECDQPIEPGDLIRYDADNLDARPSQRIRHDECPDHPDPLPLAAPGEVACPDCFLIHAIGACDR